MHGRIARREVFAFAILASPFPFRRNPSIAGIKFQAIHNGTDRRRYIWIHGNENTARDVLREHMKKTEGRAFLIENTDRNVKIAGGALDPNRMFSRTGAERNLRTLNPNWTQQQINKVLNDLDGDRNHFLNRILPQPGALMVALHNNGPAYSVKDEVAISNAVAMNDAGHLDEFMLCSAEPDFSILASGRFNVLLQNKPQGPDDGSLSRLCADRRVRYVNIEAAVGNSEAQTRMLQWLEAALP